LGTQKPGGGQGRKKEKRELLRPVQVERTLQKGGKKEKKGCCLRPNEIADESKKGHGTMPRPMLGKKNEHPSIAETEGKEKGLDRSPE